MEEDGREMAEEKPAIIRRRIRYERQQAWEKENAKELSREIA